MAATPATTAGLLAPLPTTATAAAPRPGRLRAFDPRLYQIAVLSGLLAYGLLGLDLEVRPARAALILGTALAFQYACTLAWRLPAFDPRSALISGLSLCLLLRTND